MLSCLLLFFSLFIPLSWGDQSPLLWESLKEPSVPRIAVIGKRRVMTNN